MADGPRRSVTGGIAWIRSDVASDRTGRVGAFHLLLAGAGNLAVGLGILLWAATGRLLPALLAVGPNVVTGPVLLSYGGLLPGVALLVTALGLLLSVLGVLQVVGSRRAFAGSRSRFVISCAVVGLASPPTLPPSAIAATLLALSRPEPTEDR
jgi:hypothetical protein